jgi:UDP-N-acetyl-D-mannosaminuronic acid dehydrogenase
MINVIGLGYIGLPTALMLAAHGHQVVGTDLNRELVSKLQNGETTFDEAGIPELFSQACKNGIEFAEDYKVADHYIIAVPTPYDKRSKKIDSSFVENAFKKVLEVCPENATIILESTVSPGTIDKHIRPLLNKPVHIVHAPERIIPGNMINELKQNSRTIGADAPKIGEEVKAIYSSFCQGEIVVTDIRTAEMTKVVENTYRDINIAFANELAKICRSDDLDVYEIIRIANKHPRVNILQPGPGVGGHCISVDPWFLVGDYPGLANIVLAARKINDSMPEFVLERIHTIMQENGIKDVTRVGLYGLTYKENVDDVRESPTLQLLTCMKKHLAKGIKVYDPMVKQDMVEDQYHDLDEFLDDIDIVVIMVAHNELKEKLGKFNNKIILDTRNTSCFDKSYLL